MTIGAGDKRVGVLSRNAPQHFYLMHLHNYIYGLKREAEDRARSILTASAFYAATLMWAIRFASDEKLDDAIQKVIAYSILGLAALGVIFLVLSVYYALRIFSPIVLDAESPMEPEFIVSKSIADLAILHMKIDGAWVVRALSQEIHAIARVQIIRSRLVQRCSLFFVLALGVLGICLTSIVVMFLCR